MPHAAAGLEAQVAIKRDEALKLRAGGATYREIAASLGISLSYAYQLVQESLAELRASATESADEARVVELHRLDAQYLRFMNKLVKQADNPDEATGLQLLRIAERRSKLLGLDAPQEVGGPGGGPIPIAVTEGADGAGAALFAKVEKLMQQLDAGAKPEDLAAELRKPPAEPAPEGSAASSSIPVPSTPAGAPS